MDALLESGAWIVETEEQAQTSDLHPALAMDLLYPTAGDLLQDPKGTEDVAEPGLL